MDIPLKSRADSAGGCLTTYEVPSTSGRLLTRPGLATSILQLPRQWTRQTYTCSTGRYPSRYVASFLECPPTPKDGRRSRYRGKETDQDIHLPCCLVFDVIVAGKRPPFLRCPAGVGHLGAIRPCFLGPVSPQMSSTIVSSIIGKR